MEKTPGKNETLLHNLDIAGLKIIIFLLQGAQFMHLSIIEKICYRIIIVLSRGMLNL